MRSLAAAAAVVLAMLAGPASAETPEDAAYRAMRELRFADAKTTLEAARKSGGYGRERLVLMQALLAESTAIVDGLEAGEREFRRLLVLDPQHAAPAHRSPVVTQPFERAQKWVQQNGWLKVTVVALSPVEIDVRVASDPLAMVAGARILARVSDANAFQRVPGVSLHSLLPLSPPGQSTAYIVEVLDAAENVLARLGTVEEPLHAPPTPGRAEPPRASPAPPAEPPPRAVTPRVRAPVPAPVPSVVAPATPRRPRTLLNAGIGFSVGSFGLLGTAIGLDIAAGIEYDALLRLCAPSCSPAQLGTFRLERNLSYAFYATGGAALLAGVVMIIVDRVRASHSR